MSVEATRTVWAHSRQHGEALVVLLAIADFTNADGIAWPAASTLAAKSRVCTQSLWRIIKRLEADGEIETERGGGRTLTNRYRITGNSRFGNSDFGHSVSKTMVSQQENSRFTYTKQCDESDPIRNEPLEPLEATDVAPPARAQKSLSLTAKSPERIKTARFVRRRKPGVETRLPEDFALTPELRQYEIEQNRDPDRELKSFRREYLELHPYRRSANWNGQFEKWCENKYGDRAAAPGNPPASMRPESKILSASQMRRDFENEQRKAKRSDG
jgi:hypothetical protein